MMNTIWFSIHQTLRYGIWSSLNINIYFDRDRSKIQWASDSCLQWLIVRKDEWYSSPNAHFDRVGRGLVNFLQETQTELSQWYAACVIHHALNTFRSEMLRMLTCHNIISSISQASQLSGRPSWPTVLNFLDVSSRLSGRSCKLKSKFRQQ